MTEEEFDLTPMSEKERKKSMSRLKKDIANGLCGFCGVYWKKYGHNEWCKNK